MVIAARWIRLESDRAVTWRAACTGFARAQSARSAPAVLWARPAGEDLVIALIAPLKFAPGRARRWSSWALAPLIATYRQFGMRAYLDGDGVCLGGRSVARSEAGVIGACVIVVAMVALPQDAMLDALRCRIESQHAWQFDHSWPSAAERSAIEDALALEALDAK
ncbi:MAG: hypothetical protein HYS35_02070 [Betaproteobacteria bacterium]|nr:hypothetical protein [Betaproteobacteria bacterium]